MKLTITFDPETLEEIKTDLTYQGFNLSTARVRQLIEDEFSVMFEDLTDWLVGTLEAMDPSEYEDNDERD